MLFGKKYYVGIEEGGTEKLSYVGSIGYMKDSGVGVGTAFDRFNARTNVTAKIRENLTFSSNIDYSQTNSEEYASRVSGDFPWTDDPRPFNVNIGCLTMNGTEPRRQVQTLRLESELLLVF